MSESNWWRKYKKTESRKIQYPGGNEKPVLLVGQSVRLLEKPEKIRKIIKAEWHYHRYEFVYIIETSATEQKYGFEPYWFLSQLIQDNCN